MSLIKPRKTRERIKAQRYIYSHAHHFPASITEEDINRAIAKVERVLNELKLKPVSLKSTR